MLAGRTTKRRELFVSRRAVLPRPDPRGLAHPRAPGSTPPVVSKETAAPKTAAAPESSNGRASPPAKQTEPEEGAPQKHQGSGLRDAVRKILAARYWRTRRCGGRR